jgi:hypothetical protein
LKKKGTEELDRRPGLGTSIVGGFAFLLVTGIARTVWFQAGRSR